MTAWRQEQTRDRFFRQAKRDRYRARSAYKLLELNRRFGLFKRGDAVLDLGAAPGSWSQVAAQVVGPSGRVVAVDLSPIEPLEGVVALPADILDPAALVEMRAALGRPADAVISDVSPRVSGNRLADHARSVELAVGSLEVAAELSRPGASFAVKLFRGEDFEAFVERVKRAYRQARVAVPEATRAESREAYVLGVGRF
ncbi:MAG TPA: RlmE family RNA methyltransferase [Chloroflexota bacterium]|nr:RlmE family RNA methyltransferase [Chloroflexota bacterium]